MQRRLHARWSNPFGLLVTPGLPSRAWLLQAGVLLNFMGNGLVAPYLVIYLHFSRGVPLALAALAIGSGGILATISGLVVGPLIDRFGPRTCVALAMTFNALAYAAYTQVELTWQAFAVGLAVGVGTGAYGPSVQALLAGMVSPEQRSAALSQQRMSAIVGLSIGGVAGGLIVATGVPSAYTVLLVLDAATFAAYALLLTRLPNPRIVRDAASGGYGVALRDGQLRLLTAASLAMVGSGIAPMLLVLPAFIRGIPGVPAGAIGGIYAVNTVVILLAQLRITKRVSTWKPAQALALGAATWAVSWGWIAITGALLRGGAAIAALTVAIAVYAVGECVYTGVVTPAAASLAPPMLRGRYLAMIGFSWQAGFMIGPPAAGALLAVLPIAFPVTGALVCLVLSASLVGAVRKL